MKNICILLFLVNSTLAFANKGVPDRILFPPEKMVLSENSSSVNNAALEILNKLKADEKCSITSSGRVHTANGSFTATLTVYGACNSNLAEAMRDAIQALRALFK
ncbi:MAG: hypothetical protein MUO53_15655 [Maribacter sp.]|nr:hypothetical protein [Maribacter sp.]